LVSTLYSRLRLTKRSTKIYQALGSPKFSRTQFPFQSFGLTFSYSFGKISFSKPKQQKKKKGVNNDDQIQGGDQTGGGAAPAGGR
jgi:hypothetical protein